MTALAPAIAAGVLAALVLLSASPGGTPPEPVLPEGPRHVLLGGLEGLADLPAPAERATLVVAAPTRSYGDAEARAARDFVEHGGRLLVVDPTPAAASLLRDLDVGIEATQARVFDPDVDGAGRWAAHGTGALDVSGEVRLARSRVILGDAEAVATTGPFAWRDDDADGGPDLGEPRGAWVVAARQSLGQGDVLVLGSRDLLEAPAFAAAFAAWASQGPEGPDGAPRLLVVDAGHAMAPEPLGARALLAGHRDATVALAAGMLAAVGALVAFRVRAARAPARRRRGPVDRQTLELLAELPA